VVVDDVDVVVDPAQVPVAPQPPGPPVAGWTTVVVVDEVVDVVAGASGVDGEGATVVVVDDCDEPAALVAGATAVVVGPPSAKTCRAGWVGADPGPTRARAPTTAPATTRLPPAASRACTPRFPIGTILRISGGNGTHRAHLRGPADRPSVH
jgi:hypothetical protein